MICVPEIARVVNEFEEKRPSHRGSKDIYFIMNKSKASKINFANMLYL